MNLTQLAQGLGGEVNGGQVRAPGPGHSAADRSLSVKLDPRAPDGFVTHSFAGDDPIACRDHVRDKAGLGAFKPNGRTHASGADIEALFQRAVQSQQRPEPSNRKVIETYEYKDADGVLLFQVLRYKPKDFRQRRPDGNGGWINNLDGVRRVPYRLPEIIQYPYATVFVCEGEKDADRVASLGRCATTAAAGTWTKDCVKALAGRDIIILQDNDEPGCKKAAAAAHALNGSAKSIRIVVLPDLPEKGDVSDWLDADPRRGEKLADICFDTPEWEPANAEASPPPSAKQPTLPWIDTSRWDSEPCPEREWAVKDRIPLRQVTLFSGEGAIGKSIAELMCSVAHVTGKDWFGSLPEPGGAFYFGCEDDEKEVRIRLTPIARHYGTTFEQLNADGFRFISLAGQDAVLGAPDRNGIIKSTPLFDRLYEQAGDLKPKHIGIDTAADVYAGNENERAQVRQFISLLRKLAIVSNGSVVLLSHPSLTGINTGSGLSGSTAWHNSVRSRMYMTAPKLEPGEQPDTDLRELQFKKANYARLGDSVTLRYQGGLFLPEAGLASLDKLARDQQAEDVFLDLLKHYEQTGRNVSESKTANNYGPAAFRKEQAAKGFRKDDLEAAMRRLFDKGQIHVEDYGRPSRPAYRLKVGSKK